MREGEPLELLVTDPASDADEDKEGVSVTEAHADHVPTFEVAMGVPVKLATSDVEGDWLALEDCDAVGHCDWDPEDGPLSLAQGEAV